MNAEQGYAVAHDHQLPELVGNVYLDPREATKRARVQVLLPVDIIALRTKALGGFVRRQWGNAGWVFTDNVGQRGCPTALSVLPGPSFIHWAAGVITVGESAFCKLQLVPDSNTAGGLNSGLSVVSFPKPFEMQESTVIRGVSRFNAALEGFLGLALWGVCRSVAVTWLAVSQSSLHE